MNVHKTFLAGIAALAMLAAAAPAKADVVLGSQLWTTGGATILTLEPVVPGGSQPTNVQCLICGTNQPQQSPTFGYNNFGSSGNVGEYAMFSTATIGGSLANDTVGTGYNAGFLSQYLLGVSPTLSFNIGVDVNDTGSPQILESFYFLNLTQHTVLAAFSPEPGGTPVPSLNNGTGFPDYTLSGLSLDRGDILAGDQVIFFARWSNANDGPDSFFLVPSQVAAVPEPATWAMMILGFLGVGLVGMLKRRRDGVAFRIV